MGIIQCGSFTGNTTVNIGWEPQWIMIKRADASGGWIVIDSMRGCSVGGIDAVLNPNLNNAESTANDYIDFTATGFISKNLTGTYVYIVIRRPNKPPTSGTQVYNAIARTGTSVPASITGVGFAPDLIWSQQRASLTGSTWYDRLRGAKKPVFSYSTSPEAFNNNGLVAFGMGGFTVGSDSSVNQGSLIHHLFRRSPGFMDMVCWTGTGVATPLNHGLAVKPRLIITKSLSMTADCYMNIPDAANTLSLNTNGAWSPTGARTATATTFVPVLRDNGEQFVAYLFATVSGVSKVGSYSGNGGTQTIPCGFTTGSRFILIKRIDNTGDWFVWDTARGITPTTDPHLSLNTTEAEVTTDDSIDQDASGFVVNQNVATNINALGGNYLFLAIA